MDSGLLEKSKQALIEATKETTINEDTPFVIDLTWDDATWILTASFIIFTMQTGFGMLESGCVSVKNEAYIMMKNVVDIVFGGYNIFFTTCLTYWIFGFSISFGTDPGSTPYFGIGEYAVDSDYEVMGPVFASFMFQLSFATTATTIVSGTMAERCNFRSYCLFSMLNTVVYCVPARWIWAPNSFLQALGVIDIAGSGAVHLLGGVSGYVAAWMLGPRLGRYDLGPDPLPLGNPTNCIVGLFVLWWGWLAFNSGSTFGVSGVKWKFAARAAVTTTIASIGGGLCGLLCTLFRKSRIITVMDIVNPVLGALVGITAGWLVSFCLLLVANILIHLIVLSNHLPSALVRTHDAFIIGFIGAGVVVLTSGFADYTRVDDPVGATAVHAMGGLWGMVAVGLFAEDDEGAGFSRGNSGLFKGGGTYLLKIQLLACICISVWAVFITLILLWVINKIIPIRMEEHEELLGADFVEHLVRRRNAGISQTLSALGSHPHIQEIVDTAVTIGTNNPTHDNILKNIQELNPTGWRKLKLMTVALKSFINSAKSATTTRQQKNSLSIIDETKPTKRNNLNKTNGTKTSTDEEHPKYNIATDYFGVLPTTISDETTYTQSYGVRTAWM